MLGEGGGEIPGSRKKGGEGDGDVQARSSSGMSAEETEDMERSAGAPDERADHEGDEENEGENVRRLERGEAGSRRGNGHEEGSPFERMFTDGSEEEQA